MTTHTREEEIEMMSSPGKWPHALVLPLKHAYQRQPGSGFPEHAFLVQMSMRVPTPPPEPVLYLGTLGLVSIADAERVPFGSLEDIYDSGWRVD